LALRSRADPQGETPNSARMAEREKISRTGLDRLAAKIIWTPPDAKSVR
jgi:hypothetical protein